MIVCERLCCASASAAFALRNRSLQLRARTFDDGFLLLACDRARRGIFPNSRCPRLPLRGSVLPGCAKHSRRRQAEYSGDCRPPHACFPHRTNGSSLPRRGHWPRPIPAAHPVARALLRRIPDRPSPRLRLAHNPRGRCGQWLADRPHADCRAPKFARQALNFRRDDGGIRFHIGIVRRDRGGWQCDPPAAQCDQRRRRHPMRRRARGRACQARFGRSRNCSIPISNVVLMA